jgi:hypothetical protein
MKIFQPERMKIKKIGLGIGNFQGLWKISLIFGHGKTVTILSNGADKMRLLNCIKGFCTSLTVPSPLPISRSPIYPSTQTPNSGSPGHFKKMIDRIKMQRRLYED